MHPYRTSDKTDNIKLSLKTRILSHRATPILALIVIPVLGSMILYGTGVLGCAIAHEHYSYTKTVVLGLTIWLVGAFVGIVAFVVIDSLYHGISQSTASYVVNRISDQELELLTLKQLENLQERCEDHDLRVRVAKAKAKKWNYTCTPTGVPKEQ